MEPLSLTPPATTPANAAQPESAASGKAEPAAIDFAQVLAALGLAGAAPTAPQQTATQLAPANEEAGHERDDHRDVKDRTAQDAPGAAPAVDVAVLMVTLGQPAAPQSATPTNVCSTEALDAAKGAPGRNTSAGPVRPMTVNMGCGEAGETAATTNAGKTQSLLAIAQGPDAPGVAEPSQKTERAPLHESIAALSAPNTGAVHLVHQHAPATNSVTAEVKTPVGAPDWQVDLGQRVLWMANAHHESAELRLNPPQLGPVEVKLTLGADASNQATIQFASPHADVREAIEAAIPQLRDMMAANGIALGQAMVSADSFRQTDNRGTDARGSSRGQSAPADSANDDSMRVASVRLPRREGLIDTFA